MQDLARRTGLRPTRWSMICVVVVVLIAVACGDAGEQASTTQSGAVDVPPLPGSPTFTAVTIEVPSLDGERVIEGSGLYQQYCATCHLADLSGDPNWRVPNEDGSFPPPPQDATGHTWHHSDDLLLEIISVGSDFPESVMPAFGDQLTNEQIVSILEFIKASWGAEERSFQWEQTLRSQSQE